MDTPTEPQESTWDSSMMVADKDGTIIPSSKNPETYGQGQIQNQNVHERSGWRLVFGGVKIIMGTGDVLLGVFILTVGVSTGGIALPVCIFPAVGLIGGGGMGVYYGYREFYDYYSSGDQRVRSIYERR